MLAIRRGAAEGYLIFRIAPPEDAAIAILEKAYVRGTGPCTDQVRLAVKDCYKRLLSMSMETEARLESKKRADAAAIEVFAQNLRQLLLAPPLGQKRVLAIDPGFRTGCKTVVLDAQGKLLYHDVIYPDQGERKRAEAENDRVLLVADGTDDDWWRMCVRQADQLVLVAPWTARAFDKPPLGRADADLVLVGARPPHDQVRAWASAVRPWQVLCVDPADLDAGLRPLAVRLAGRSVGLVLAGGKNGVDVCREVFDGFAGRGVERVGMGHGDKLSVRGG